ncbi:hypothetical protein YC2023_016564 [Brassica napus]
MRLSNWTNPFGVIISLLASSCFAPFLCLNLFRLSLHYGSGFLILEFSPLTRMLDIGGDSLALEFKHRGMARFLAGIRLLGYGSDLFSFLDLSRGLNSQLRGCRIDSSVRRLRQCSN